MNKYKHVPYSRAKGRDYSKQAKGFAEIRPPMQHPKLTFTAPAEHDPTPVGTAKYKVAMAKQGAAHAFMRARGRRLTVDAGVRLAKLELREARGGKRRK